MAERQHIEVCAKESVQTPTERRLKEEIQQFLKVDLEDIKVVTSYQLETQLSADELRKVASEALIDPVLEDAHVNSKPKLAHDWCVSISFRPGVTDNLGSTAAIAIKDCIGKSCGVRSARRYLLKGQLTEEAARQIAEGWLGNPLIEHLELRPGKPYDSIDLEVSDEELLAISQNNTLALSLEEMQAIRDYYRKDAVRQERKKAGLPSGPTDAELEALAQTWSEHCKHKIFAAKIAFRNGDETRTVDGVFKTYIRGATEEIAKRVDWLVSVFHDNAGIIKLNAGYNVNFKVETHNSPSALDPYGGALTGILGVNRDSMGTGVGARLLANTDVFCFAPPDYDKELPPRLLHPRRVLRGVRLGVEHGGNKSGVPTVNGSLVFHENYLGKPLVYCGSVGLMPCSIANKKTEVKEILPGDLIVIMGGRTGRDGIHGATFSSEELHEGSPSSAVQIGDPFTQKKVHDCLLEARDAQVYRTLTDNGAGGFSSSVGEMAELSGGCHIQLEKAPLKAEGLRPWEILLSESQERMTLAVDPKDLPALQLLADKHEVEIACIGQFTDTGHFHVSYEGEVVADLPMDFLHEGVPQLQLEAEWTPAPAPVHLPPTSNPLVDDLKQVLARPNVCSKEAIIRQYDHEVQGGTIVKPLCGANNDGPSDAAVIQPVEVLCEGGREGLVISNGICPRYSDLDPYAMAQLAVDEAMRNIVATGGNPAHTALLDNFCWPDPIYHPEKTPDGKRKLAQLVMAGQALYDIATAWDAPFISGKDSMKNDYKLGDVKISIPPTLLISAIAKIDDINKAVTMDVKATGHKVYVLGLTKHEMGGSEYACMRGEANCGKVPNVDVHAAKKSFTALHQAMQEGLVASCHDCSDGGLLVALAESAFAGGYGMKIHLEEVPHEGEMTTASLCFSESASRFVLTVDPENEKRLQEHLEGISHACIGEVIESTTLHIDRNGTVLEADIAELKAAWQGGDAF